MGKADKKRVQQMIDTQGRVAQNQINSVNNSLGTAAGNYQNAMWGAPEDGGGGTPNPGSAVPRAGGQYTPTGDGRTNPNGSGTPSGDIKGQLMSYLQSLGPASSETLERALPEIQRMFPGARRDTSGGPLDELFIPGVGLVDLIANAETGGPKSWTFQTGSSSNPMNGQGGIVGQTMRDYGNIMGKYEGFAKTGGFSEQDLANIRARSISPIRSVYSNAHRELDRSRSLQGGYSPGYTTALGRFAREQGQLTSDATTNAEAGIAQMVQQGKLAGMGGMAGIYGSTPGMAQTFGNQALGANQQRLGGAGLQEGHSQGMINDQINHGNMRGFNWGALWKTLGTGAAVAAASSKTFKHDIKEVKDEEILSRLKKIKIFDWKYKDDPEQSQHVGPMAEDFKKVFGHGGDGKSIAFIDAIGTSLALNKALANKVDRLEKGEK